MKFSEKGKRKLLDNRYWFSEEFDQGDFEDCVMLTSEEAKDLLSWLRNSQWKHKHQCNFEFAEDWRKDMFDCLNERIEQTEATNLCDDYRKTLNMVANEFQKQSEDSEEVVKYDPKVWNEYPKVMPPKEGWYRIQYEVECVGYVRRVVYWNGTEWETHHLFVEKFAFCFKPWDDECGCFQIGKERVNDSVKKVELTVEEAKAVNDLILKLFYNEENRMSVFNATEILTKRIGQSGGK